MIKKDIFKMLWSCLTCLSLVALLLGSVQIRPAQAEGEFDLEIGLKAPQHVAPGSNALINLSYSNIGTAELPADTRIEVTLPEGLSFVSAVDQSENPLLPDETDGNVYTWMVGALPPGSCCAHIWITTLVGDDLAEETALTTTGEIGSELAETNLTNNLATATSQVCDMAGSQKKANVEQAKPGDIVTYTITLRLAHRQGTNGISGRSVTLTDILPPAEQARFLGWVGGTAGTFDGKELRWQGMVGENSPVMLQYRLGIEGEVPPGDLVTNQARVHWSGGEMELEPAQVKAYLTDDDRMFGPVGGQWQHSWGLTLEVPPDAVRETTRFQFQAASGPPPEAPPGWIYANRAFEMNAFQFGEIHQFEHPLEFTLRYQIGDVDGILPNSLRLWYRSGPGEPWAMLGEPVQNQFGEITFRSDHFTEFALFGQPGYFVRLPMLFR